MRSNPIVGMFRRVLCMVLLFSVLHGIEVKGGIWKDIREDRWSSREAIVLVNEMLEHVKVSKFDAFEDMIEQTTKSISMLARAEIPKHVLKEYTDDFVESVEHLLKPLDVAVRENISGAELEMFFKSLLEKRVERFAKRVEKAIIEFLKGTIPVPLSPEILEMVETSGRLVGNAVISSIVLLFNHMESDIDNKVLERAIRIFRHAVSSVEYAGDESYFVSLFVGNVVYQACYRGNIGLGLGLLKFFDFAVRNPSMVEASLS